MNTNFLNAVLRGDNYPPDGSITYDFMNHERYQNGKLTNRYNFGCIQRLVIEKNVDGGEGYTVSLYGFDKALPSSEFIYTISPTPMRIIRVEDAEIEFRGYGHDTYALGFGMPLEVAMYANEGISIVINSGEIISARHHIYNRDITIVYCR